MRSGRAVVITATEPEPRRYGKQVVLGGILDHLVQRLGAEAVHLVLIGDPGAERPAVPYRRHVVPRPGPAAQAWSVLRDVVLPPGSGRYRRPLQEAVLAGPAVTAGVRAELARIRADVEIWDTVRTGQHAPSVPRRPGARRVLYADDLFSERYAAMLADPGSGNPGGEFQKLLPGPARALLASPRVYRPLLRLERDLVAASEQRQPAWFDATYLISDAEAARLRSRLGPSGPPVESLPPLLREPRALLRQPFWADQANFVFVGGFDYAPNRDGLDWFLANGREAVDAALPGATITVIGAGTERGLPSAAGWGDRVRFLGWVADLDAELGRAVALLSPLRSGSGVKIKVLEALARGLPVVATPAGVQGVDGGEQAGCLVGSGPLELAAAMARAAVPEENDRLSKAARITWDSRYAPPVVTRRYDAAFLGGDQGILPIPLPR